MYGCAMKSKLSIIDPVRNKGIHLAMAPSMLAVLRVCILNLKSLYFIYRGILLCGYAPKLTAQPNYPSHAVVFNPTICSRYKCLSTCGSVLLPASSVT